ncbi:hypothetical protein HanRHA438_Chr03g0116531 [Helianthus annuus]|nr:hypothetical protein HanIR_Chr03g0115551 [Helianthus annuus]KAJ0935223.1 hypothetical protein HanRHA438_Chr03g0116531 [Helianthus annuus]
MMHETKLAQLSDKSEILTGVQYLDRHGIETQNEPETKSYTSIVCRKVRIIKLPS